MNRLSFHPRFYLSITINVNLCNLILYQASFFHIFNNLNELLIKEVSLVFETSGKILILFFWEQLFAEIKIWIIFAPVPGRLAQLVQSICLTSRGSAVRIRQLPPKSTFYQKYFFFISYNFFDICSFFSLLQVNSPFVNTQLFAKHFSSSICF